MKKRKIYIADSFSLNSGDIGILAATVSSIRNSVEHAYIVVEASHPEIVEKYGLEYDEIYPRIFDISKIDFTGSPKYHARDVILGVYDSFTFAVFGSLCRLGFNAHKVVRRSRRRQAGAIRSTSLWLSSGGGYLSSNYKFGFRLYGYLLAVVMRKKLLLFAQSIGPFTKTLHLKAAKVFLNRSDEILVREPESYGYLKGLSLNIDTKIKLTADIAFLLESKPIESIAISNNMVAICVKSSKSIKTLIESAATKLASSGCKLLFISQTPNDDALAKDLSSTFKENAQFIAFGLDPRQLKWLYGKCKFIISSRMHAIIFASEQAVPWVGLGYEPKFLGLFEQVGDCGILIENKNLSVSSLGKAIDDISKIDPTNMGLKLEELRYMAKQNVLALHKHIVNN